jgi:hypothetical protein
MSSLTHNIRSAGLVATQMTMDGLSIFAIVVSLVYNLTHPKPKQINIRGLVTFGTLWLSGLCGSIIMTLNAHSQFGNDFVNAFEGAYAHTFLGLSWIATASAFIGLGVCYFDLPPAVRKEKPIVYPGMKFPDSPPPSSSSIPPSMYSKFPPMKPENPGWSNVKLGV